MRRPPAAARLAAHAAALVAFTAVACAAETAAPAGDRLVCGGALGRDASHASVVAAYGKENVVFTKVEGAEGEKIDATVVFPKDPKRRLELFWNDGKKRSGLLSVNLSAVTGWTAPNGLKLGMPLAEVERLNGRPFALSGFDWDYGGYVTDWKGGVLAGPSPGGCTVHVRFAEPESAPAAAATAVSGDREFLSTDRDMRAVKPVISSLGFGYPQP